jgi:hypothetical protein
MEIGVPMRLVVTGNRAGRSRVVYDGPAEGLPADVAAEGGGAPVPSLVATALWSHAAATPGGAQGERANPGFEHLDLGLGSSRWVLFTPGADYQSPMHRTATVDYDLCLKGSIVLTLDDDVVTLAPGDGVVLLGVRHAWSTGDEGATVAVMMVGTGS